MKYSWVSGKNVGLLWFQWLNVNVIIGPPYLRSKAHEETICSFDFVSVLFWFKFIFHLLKVMVGPSIVTPLKWKHKQWLNCFLLHRHVSLRSCSAPSGQALMCHCGRQLHLTPFSLWAPLNCCAAWWWISVQKWSKEMFWSFWTPIWSRTRSRPSSPCAICTQ